MRRGDHRGQAGGETVRTDQNEVLRVPAFQDDRRVIERAEHLTRPTEERTVRIGPGRHDTMIPELVQISWSEGAKAPCRIVTRTGYAVEAAGTGQAALRGPARRRDPRPPGDRSGTLAGPGHDAAGWCGLQPRQETRQRLRAHRQFDLAGVGPTTQHRGIQRHRVTLGGAGRATIRDLQAEPGDHVVGAGTDRQHPVPDELVTAIPADADLPALAAGVDPAAQRHVDATLTQQAQATQGVHREHDGQPDEEHPYVSGDPHGRSAFRLAQTVCPAARSWAAALARTTSSSSLRSVLALAMSMSGPNCADSARMLTRSPVTERKPPCTAAMTCSPSVVSMQTKQSSISSPSSGMCRGRMPISPTVVLVNTALAWPDHNRPSTATSSTVISATVRLLQQLVMGSLDGPQVINPGTPQWPAPHGADPSDTELTCWPGPWPCAPGPPGHRSGRTPARACGRSRPW